MTFSVADRVQPAPDRMGALWDGIVWPAMVDAIVKNGIRVVGDKCFRREECFQLAAPAPIFSEPEFDLEDMELAEIIMDEMK